MAILLVFNSYYPVYAKSKVDKLMEQANFLYYHGDLEEAIKRFEMALELEPDHFDTHMSLVNLYLKFKKNEEAIEHARKVVELKPDSETAHLMLGNLLRTNNDTVGAIKEYEAAIKLGTKNPNLIMNLGQMYAKANQLNKALSYYEQASAFKKYELGAGLHVAVIKFRLGKNDEAIEKLNQLKDEFGATSSLLTTQGTLLAGMKKYEEAKAAFKAALKLNSQNPSIYKNLANIELRQKNRKGALQVYKDAVKVMPDSAFLYAELGDLYFLVGDKDSSRESFKRAVKLNPKYAKAYYALAVLALKRKDTVNASKYYQLGAEVEKDVKKKERMMRAAMNLKLKAGLDISQAPEIGAPVALPTVAPTRAGLFPVSYADLVNIPNSKWLELDKKVSTYKPQKRKQKLFIPKMKAPRIR